jgi:hypothetical protein
LALFGGYWALFEARYWGEVGIWLPTSDLYKLGLLESMEDISEQVYAEYFPSQIHFYAGKLLRSAPLRAISGSFGHPISVSFLLLGSRDLVEKYQINFVTFWYYFYLLINLLT